MRWCVVHAPDLHSETRYLRGPRQEEDQGGPEESDPPRRADRLIRSHGPYVGIDDLTGATAERP